MTATDPAPMVCPQCGATNTAVAGSGSGMCFECSHMWDPAEVVALPRPALEPFAMADVDDVFGTPDVPAVPPDPHDFPATWAGLADFRHSGGSMPNEVWWEQIMGAPLEQIDPIAEVEPDPPVEAQAAMMLAAEILAAGITAAYTLANPAVQFMAPTGYLPADKAMLPIVEQACAVAIGMLIDATDTTAEWLAERFGVVLESVSQGDPTTEVTDDERSSEAE